MDQVILRLAAAASLLALSVGCSSMQTANAGLRASTAFRPEPSTTWSRPMEVGYDFTGEEIEGTAEVTSILFGLISFGAADASLLTGVLGLITGGGADNDTLSRAAAFNAVERGTAADGIYVTRSSGNTVDFLGIYRKSDMKVKGKALRLRVIGEVSQERADRERYLLSLPGGTMEGAAVGGPIGNILNQLLSFGAPAAR